MYLGGTKLTLHRYDEIVECRKTLHLHLCSTVVSLINSPFALFILGLIGLGRTLIMYKQRYSLQEPFTRQMEME